MEEKAEKLGVNGFVGRSQPITEMKPRIDGSGWKVIVKCHQLVDKSVSLGLAWGFEKPHALRVSTLALRLFDQLQPLHGMGNTERIWLRTAALLHDIAKPRHPRCHHKVARDVILKATELPFRRGDRVMIALAARYHRGSLPNKAHAYYRDLDAESRRYVAKLAALLRLADGLDKGRTGVAEELRCQIDGDRVRLTAFSRGFPSIDKALRKSDLFTKVFGNRVLIDVETIHPCLGFNLDPADEMAYARSA